MAQWNHIQRDFSGGEIGATALMRDDIAHHEKSVLEMVNFMPRLSGSALRTPGTRFVAEAAHPDSRLIPFHAPNNERAIVEMAPSTDTNPTGEIIIHRNWPALQTTSAWTPDNYFAETQVDVEFLRNPYFTEGLQFWGTGPTSGPSSIVGLPFPKGLHYLPDSNNVQIQLADDSEETEGGVPGDRAFIQGQATILEETDRLTFRPRILYAANFASSPNPRYLCYVEVFNVTTDEVYYRAELDGGWDRENQITSDVRDLPGARIDTPVVIAGPFTVGMVIGVRAYFEAVRLDGESSSPRFVVGQLSLLTRKTVDFTPGVVFGDVPYTEEEIDKVQFVQSPFVDSFPGNAYGNQLVTVHPEHKQKHLYWNGTSYQYQDINFRYVTVGPDGGVSETDLPDDHPWSDLNQAYPSAVTSFLGRCIFAGGTEEIIFDPIGSVAQRVICTVVGKWNWITNEENQDDVLATDSVTFTSTFRSPIKWVLGQKYLLIGAQDFEYTSASDGIFQPGDLGVVMQSTHGSSGVQPVNMGQWCLFPADNGKALRRMNYLAEDESWVSPDLTILHPNILQSGIRRMVRLANPHQMAVILAYDGNIRLLHLDTNENLFGWSRLDVGGQVQDICVMPNAEGIDILFMTVRRIINGEEKVYIEAIVNWEDTEVWTYVNSGVFKILDAPGNVVDGLDHLEGANVQVIADGNFYGTFPVEGGAVTLVNQIGQPIEAQTFVVGLAAPCRLLTLPLVTSEPDSKKRYTEIAVRTLFSTRPIINGERPDARDPQTPQNSSQLIDTLYDSKIAWLGSNPLQQIVIEEDVPLRVEIIGIFGRVKGEKI